MPIIEYRCRECSQHFDVLQSRTEDPATPCPHCKASGAERLLSVFAVSRPSSVQSPGPCGADDCACRRTS